jgi:two-component system chemotaxis response regulator CheB
MSIRAVVVDDSSVVRSSLRRMFEADPEIRVVGEASDGPTALAVVERVRPDIVTMDIGLPGMGGLEVIEEIMARFPVPILVVTGQSDLSNLTFEAIRRGALDLAEKPIASLRGNAATAFSARLKLLAKVPVVVHVARGRRAAKESGARPAPQPLPKEKVRPFMQGPVVGIAASAGGPGALATLLGRFGPDFPGCFALVQHLPKGFTPAFAEFLRSRTSLEVIVADGPVAVRPGAIVLSSDRHLIALDRDHFDARSDAAVRGFRPSANVLFESLARTHGKNAVGVILSGIGDDGVAGLSAMRKAGALTVAQDQATSAVFGMPRAAIECGAAELVRPIGAIADELFRVCVQAPTRKGARGA